MKVGPTGHTWSGKVEHKTTNISHSRIHTCTASFLKDYLYESTFSRNEYTLHTTYTTGVFVKQHKTKEAKTYKGLSSKAFQESSNSVLLRISLKVVLKYYTARLKGQI